MTLWRSVVAAVLVSGALSACSALEGPPEHWRSESTCEDANPGHRCSYSTCDQGCGINDSWSGWVPVSP